MIKVIKSLIMKTKPQKTLIKEWFESGKALSAFTAVKELGITQLSARFVELKKNGYEIWSHWATYNRKRFKIYFTSDHPDFDIWIENFKCERI